MAAHDYDGHPVIIDSAELSELHSKILYWKGEARHYKSLYEKERQEYTDFVVKLNQATFKSIGDNLRSLLSYKEE